MARSCPGRTRPARWRRPPARRAPGPVPGSSSELPCHAQAGEAGDLAAVAPMRHHAGPADARDAPLVGHHVPAVQRIEEVAEEREPPAADVEVPGRPEVHAVVPGQTRILWQCILLPEQVAIAGIVVERVDGKVDGSL